MKTRVLSVLCLAGAVSLFTAGASRAMTGAELMKEVRNRNNSRTQITQISMALIDKKGRSQDRKLRVWAEQIGDTENTLTRFLEPKRVEGVGFLVVSKGGGQSDRYLYTPSQKQTRKVPEGDNNKSFQGTDFTYYDLSPHDVNSDNYEPLTETTLDGHKCWVCTSRPKGADALYSKVIQWVRQDIYVPIKMEFYDKSGALLKVSQVNKLDKVDGYWTPLESVMHDVQIDHKTIMKIDKIQYDTELPDQIFSKSNLERGA